MAKYENTNSPSIVSPISNAQDEPTLCEVIIYGHIDVNDKLLGKARWVGQSDPSNEPYDVNCGIILEPDAGTDPIGDIIVKSVGGTVFATGSFARIYQMKAS